MTLDTISCVISGLRGHLCYISINMNASSTEKRMAEKKSLHFPARYAVVTTDVAGAGGRYPAKRMFSGSSCPAMRAELDAISMHVLEKSFALHVRREETEKNTQLGMQQDRECPDSEDGGSKTSTHMPETRDVAVAQEVEIPLECKDSQDLAGV